MSTENPNETEGAYQGEREAVEGFAQEIGTEVVRASTLAVMPTVEARELVGRLAVIRDAMENAMERDVDYGVIPGTNKPALLKPGAEKLSVLFQLDVQLVNEKLWGPGDHLTVMSRAIVHHAPTGLRLGFGEGLCTTKEKKYAKRQQDRACPGCGAATIKRSKFPPRNQPSAEPGWYCFAKIGGCGAQFDAGDPTITEQSTGAIENPELPDAWNTVVKMAEKRARVDAVLAVTGASALFTQDVEDQHAPASEPHDPRPVRRDVKQTPGRSDIPAEDVWWATIRAQLDAIKPALNTDQLRGMVESVGGKVPENVGSWKTTICKLDDEQRERFGVLLQEWAEAGTPLESAA